MRHTPNSRPGSQSPRTPAIGVRCATTTHFLPRLRPQRGVRNSGRPPTRRARIIQTWFADSGRTYCWAHRPSFSPPLGTPALPLNCGGDVVRNSVHPLHLGSPSRGIFLVRLAAEAGRDDLAARSPRSSKKAPAAAVAQRSCGGVAVSGRRGPERRSRPRSRARYRETALRPDLAACCEDAAGLLGACGRRDEAIALLRDAATIYAQVSASADLYASTPRCATSAHVASNAALHGLRSAGTR